MRRTLWMLCVVFFAVLSGCGWNSSCGRFYLIEDISCTDLSSLTIEPTSVALGVGDTSQFSAFFSRSGTNMPIRVPANGVRWSSSNAAVATVANTGRVSARGEGQAVVTASVPDFDGGTFAVMATVTVRPSLADGGSDAFQSAPDAVAPRDP